MAPEAKRVQDEKPAAARKSATFGFKQARELGATDEQIDECLNADVDSLSALAVLISFMTPESKIAAAVSAVASLPPSLLLCSSGRVGG